MTDLSITGDGRLSGATPKDKLRAVANQFEGVFLNQLLSRLDQGSFTDDPLVGGSNASKQFSELFHQALGEKAAGTLGVADAIYARLAVHLKATDAAPAPEAAKPEARRADDGISGSGEAGL